MKVCQSGHTDECIPGCANLASKCLRLPVDLYDWCQSAHANIETIAAKSDWRYAARHILTALALQLREWNAAHVDDASVGDEAWQLIERTKNVVVVLADSAAAEVAQ